MGVFGYFKQYQDLIDYLYYLNFIVLFDVVFDFLGCGVIVL